MAFGEEAVWQDMPADRSVSHTELRDLILRPGGGFYTGIPWRDDQIAAAAVTWLISGGWIIAELDVSQRRPGGATQIHRYRKLRRPRAVVERERVQAEAAAQRAAIANVRNAPIDARLAELGLLPRDAAA